MKNIMKTTIFSGLLCIAHLTFSLTEDPRLFSTQNDLIGKVVAEEYEYIGHGKYSYYEKVCTDSERFCNGNQCLFKCTKQKRGRVLRDCDGEWQYCYEYSYSPTGEQTQIFRQYQ